jgi:lipopolysaccharide export system permease protein
MKGPWLKIIDLYIIKKFLGSFLLTLGLFTIIIIVFDVSEKLDEFVGKKAPLKEIVFDYYVNFIPFLLNLFSPIFVFISVIFFTSKMASKSEFVAMLAGGVPYLRILRPYILTGIVIGFMSYQLNAWIIPRSDKVRVEFENKYTRDLSTNFKRNIKRQIRPGVVMSLKNYNYLDSFGYKLRLDNIVDGRMVSRLEAEKLKWNHENSTWMVENYKIRSFDPDGTEHLDVGLTLDTMIQFDPEGFFRRDEDVQSFNMNELDEYIALGKMMGIPNLFFYETEKQRRYANPFSMIILTFIGVCVSSIKSRQGIGWHLAKGVLISFAYLFVMQFFNSYGSSGVMHPLAAVWVPNFLFLGVGIALYRTTQK